MGDEDSSRLVTVSCSSHHETLIAGLWYFLTGKYLLDCDLVGDGRKTRAHQLVADVFLPPRPTDLEGADPLNTLLDLDMTQPENDSSNLASLVEFMYNGTVTVRYDRLDQLLTMAKELNFRMLVDAVQAARASKTMNWQSDGGAKTTDSPRYKRGHVHVDGISDSDDDWDFPAFVSSKVAPSSGDRTKTPDRDWPDDDDCPNDDNWSPLLSSDSDIDFADAIEQPEPRRQLRSRLESDTPAVNATNTEKSSYNTRSMSFDEPALTVASNHAKNNVKLVKTATLTNKTKRRNVQSRAKPSEKTGGATVAVKTAKPQQLVLRTCPECSWQTRNVTHFKVHMSKHDSRIKLYRCPICNKPFTCPDSMANHQLRHQGEPERFQCEYCAYSAPKKQTLKSHQNYRHRVEIGRERKTKSAHCTLCNYSAYHQSALRLHVMMRHTGEKPIKCTECSYSTVRSTDLAKHIRVVHQKIKLFICEICGLKCGHNGALRQHSRVHSKEKPFVCTLCDKAYSHSSQLKEHEKWHADAPKQHHCPVCSSSFRRRDHLRNHLRGVHKMTMEAVSLQEGNQMLVTTTVNSADDIV